MKLFVALFVLFHLSTIDARANCRRIFYGAPENTTVSSSAVLMITHATRMPFDPSAVAKNGMNAAYRFARRYSLPIVALASGSDGSGYYFDDCHPDYFMQSSAGEFSFNLDSSHIFFAGGNFELCLSRTVKDVLKSFKNRIEEGASKQDLVLSFVTNGIYMLKRATDLFGIKKTVSDHLKEQTSTRDQDRFLKRYSKSFKIEDFANFGYRVVVEVDGRSFDVIPAADPVSPKLVFQFLEM
jgi:hypothetical protein